MKTFASLITTSFFFIFLQSNLMACRQLPDILIYNNDKLPIRDYPLEQFFKPDQKRPDFFENYKLHRMPQNTGCWRGYQAYWIIIDNQLYLTSIKSCNEFDNLKKANLKKLFGNKLINGKVKADWFTGSIIAEIGEPIIYLNFSDFLFSYEEEFNITQGHLTETKCYDNTKSRQSKYFLNFEMFEDYIYKNVNWAELPDLAEKVIESTVNFYSDENGIIDSAFVEKHNIKIFDDEAIRVIKLIPEWNICLREGKQLRIEYHRTVVFTNENKNKYYKPKN